MKMVIIEIMIIIVMIMIIIVIIMIIIVIIEAVRALCNLVGSEGDADRRVLEAGGVQAYYDCYYYCYY